MRLLFKSTKSRSEYWDQNIHVKNGDIVNVSDATAKDLMKFYPDNFQDTKNLASATVTYIQSKTHDKIASELEHLTPHIENSAYLKTKRPKGDLAFTYFYDIKSGYSFAIVARNHIRVLRNLGYKVEEKDLSLLKNPLSFQRNHFCIVHPMGFTAMVRNYSWDIIIKSLSESFRYIVGFEVADSTEINQRYIKWFNNPSINGICVPSQFSYNSFKLSGITNRVFVVPHGINPLFKPKPKKDGEIRIISFQMHSGYRKGLDIVLKVAEHFPNVKFIIKIDKNVFPVVEEKLKDKKNIILFGDILPEDKLVELYQSCDLYLNPYRGGAWELPTSEAMACGLPIISTGWGCVLDYVNIHNSLLAPVTKLARLFSEDNFHSGFGAELDYKDFVYLLDYALLHFKECKEKALAVSEEIRKKYTWENAMKLFIEDCKEIMAED